MNFRAGIFVGSNFLFTFAPWYENVLKKLKIMIEFTITGIRYQMGNHLNRDEATDAARRFVAGLEKGLQVVLMAEPDNPMDTNAIAAYIDYKRIGYIDKEETAEVRDLLDDDQQCDGVVERTDGNITFFISIPGAAEKIKPHRTRTRILPDSPLGENVFMPFAENEKQLKLIATRLTKIEVNKDNLHTLMELAERYVPLTKLSICYEDCVWLNKISKILHKASTQHQNLGATEDEAAKLTDLYNKVKTSVGDMHRTAEHWPERVFVEHLDRLRNDASVIDYLYKKYRNTFLGGLDFAEADKQRVFEEYERLYEWLRGMEWCELRNHRNLKEMGLKVNYLRISRRELYDLYSVLLLIERLEEQIEGQITNRKEIVAKLKNIFYGMEAEANNFLLCIQGMKPTQITDKVNQLVAAKKISEYSKKHDLWSVLHEYGYYNPTESNWNQQVK